MGKLGDTLRPIREMSAARARVLAAEADALERERDEARSDYRYVLRLLTGDTQPAETRVWAMRQLAAEQPGAAKGEK